MDMVTPPRGFLLKRYPLHGIWYPHATGGGTLPYNVFHAVVREEESSKGSYDDGKRNRTKVFLPLREALHNAHDLRKEDV